MVTGNRLSAALAATALAAMLATVPARADDGARTAPSGVASLRLGALVVTALRDGGYVSPNDGGDFGANVGPKAVAKLLAAAGAPTDQVRLAVDALLVRGAGRIVLIDAGTGPDNHGALLASLKLAGVAPDQVTDVLITHAHFDHVGGLIDAAGRSAFPKAVIWFNAGEWAAMLAVPGPHRITPAIAAQVRTFQPGQEILPGITPIALYGHTAGHVGYQIVSEGQALEDIGDTVHSSIVELAEPAWRGGIDENPAAGAATRVAELKRLAAAHTLIFAPHFPFPGVGWLVPTGDGYAWKPDPELR
jgi:glyoxylase-like metal-dependent hydrolase (beta-lactamase superfamily II)